MQVEIQINNSSDPGSRYLTWSPSPCRARVTDPSGIVGPAVDVTLSSSGAAGAGRSVFGTVAGGGGGLADTLTLTLPASGQSVSFLAAGAYGHASVNDRDVRITASASGSAVGSVDAMVRIRKDAQALTPPERDRFVSAFARLNNQGLGRFADFRDMHVQSSLREAHGAAGFLCWHRAYILDLERELQAIDPGVALPYWRFDRPAPDLFTPEFLGRADPSGTVQFGPSNPLQFWKVDGRTGVDRLPLFNAATGSPTLLSEAGTIALGITFRQFRTMEGDPHGEAHVGFDGPINTPATAPRDPLFFLLHCNVDRLWARWQRTNARFDPSVGASFDTGPNNPIGHRLGDTMWPWNGVTVPPRPPTAPGGALASSTSAVGPGPSPRVQDCLDYQGRIAAANRMGFDYDDTPYD